MNMCVGSSVYLVVINLSIVYMAINSALKLVCKPDNLFDIHIFIFVGCIFRNQIFLSSNVRL